MMTQKAELQCQVDFLLSVFYWMQDSLGAMKTTAEAIFLSDFILQENACKILHGPSLIVNLSIKVKFEQMIEMYIFILMFDVRI